MEIKSQSESQEQAPSPSTQPNPNKLTLVPYVLYEGAWTLPDHFLRLLVQEFKDEGTFDTVFFDGRVSTADEFIQLVQSPVNAPVFIFLDRVCVGVGWLNGQADNMAYVHFCFKKQVWGKHTLKMGRMLMDYWFAFPGSGGPLFEFLFGLMPGFNKAATHFVSKLGWTFLGSVPGMIRHKAGRTSAEIYYISRFDYGEKGQQSTGESSV